MARRRGGGIALWLIVAVMAGCMGSDRVPDAAKSIRTAITPPDGRALPPLAQKGEHDAEVAWVVETSWAWETYADWVQDRLARDYALVATSPEQLRFRSRTSEAVLVLRPVGGGGSARVRATFTAGR